MFQLHERFVIDANGHSSAVMLDIREYRKLRKRLEDLEDSKYLKAHRHEHTIPFEQVVAELKTKRRLASPGREGAHAPDEPRPQRRPTPITSRGMGLLMERHAFGKVANVLP